MASPATRQVAATTPTPTGGAGFCVFNDGAVAIRVLQADGLVGRALVIDLDVHQGDGTARIFAGDDSVMTYSVHAAENYPARKAGSDHDIALPDGVRDEAYLEMLGETLPGVIESAAPDIILYNAGVDPHEDDKLGRLSLSDAGLAARDRAVLTLARKRRLPIACMIGGGYADDVQVLARRHATLHRAAATVFTD
jgi:acetoin utilization deacetylase AcuC-like enzyme